MEFVGQKFTYLTVLSEPESYVLVRTNGKKQKLWQVLCKCDCGIEKYVRLDMVRNGKIKSCGCYNKELASKRMKEYAQKYSNNIIQHQLYGSWKNMKNKCYNIKSPYYLGGHIYVDDLWLASFENFYNWGINLWFENSVLVRNNNNDNFSPTNCRFEPKSYITKQNINADKAKQTCIERYGVDHPAKTAAFQAKKRTTSIEKYGVEYASQLEDVKQKSIKTCIQKYGFDRPSKSQKVKDKMANTNMEKYGYVSPSQNTQVRQKQIDTCIEKYGVPFYNKTNSTQQNQLKIFIDSFGKEFVSNRKILEGKEIDLYNEELKLGIEYCGLRWHGESESRGPLYHYRKYKICKDNQIRLITIFSDEWLKRQSQVKNFLRATLGKCENKLFGRNCVVKEVDKTIGRQFIDDFHIQKSGRAAIIYIGIYWGNILCGLISLNKHHTKNDSRIITLDRMVFRDNFAIIGGVSKLVSYAKQWCITNKYDKIVTWSDNRWTEGMTYEKCGFVLEKNLKSDYSYTYIDNPISRIPKQSMRKKSIGCPSDKTESEFTKELGFIKVWDCGKKRWILQIS